MEGYVGRPFTFGLWSALRRNQTCKGMGNWGYGGGNKRARESEKAGGLSVFRHEIHSHSHSHHIISFLYWVLLLFITVFIFFLISF